MEKACETVLRKAEERDFPSILSLYRSAIGSPGLPWTEAYPSEREIAADHSRGCLYVLACGGELIGAASALPSKEAEDRRELARVVIDKKRRKAGYAREMMRLLFAELSENGCRSVILYVAAGNEAAIRTYRSLGFDFRDKCRLSGYDDEFYPCEKALEPR